MLSMQFLNPFHPRFPIKSVVIPCRLLETHTEAQHIEHYKFQINTINPNIILTIFKIYTK